MQNAVAIKRGKRPRSLLLPLARVSTFTAYSAAAQFDTGTVSGTTVDSSGAALPDSSITVTRPFGDTEGKRLGRVGRLGSPVRQLHGYFDRLWLRDPTSKKIVLNVGAALHVR